MTLGIVDEAQTSAAVLGHNFPDSRWYKDAYNLVQRRACSPSENKGSWISRAFKGSARLIAFGVSRHCARCATGRPCAAPAREFNSD